MTAKIERNAVNVLPIFNLISKVGNIPERDMFNTYNMGVGMMLAVDAADADKTVAALQAAGEEAFVVGHVEAGEKGVTLV